MLRVIAYITILSIIALIPFQAKQKSEKQSFKRISKHISITIVEPQQAPKKTKHPKKTKPKKIIKKKVIKKKPILKPLPKPKPKPKIVKEVKKPVKVTEKPVVEEVKKPVKVEEESIEEEVEQTLQQTTLQTKNSSIKNEYYALIYERINKNKHYPRKSRRHKEEDTIPVSFMIDKNGYISAFKIVKKSRYKTLNRAVQKVFKKIKKFSTPPREVETPLEISLEINFSLQR